MAPVRLEPAAPRSRVKHSTTRPVYIESRVCVVKGVVKCSFEYLCVVRHDTRRRHNVGVGEGTIKKRKKLKSTLDQLPLVNTPPPKKKNKVQH